MSLGSGIENFNMVVKQQDNELVAAHESLVFILIAVFGAFAAILGALISLAITLAPYIFAAWVLTLIYRLITNKSSDEYKQIKSVIDKLQVKLDKAFMNASNISNKFAAAISGELNKAGIKGKATISKNFTKEEFYKKISKPIADAAKNNQPVPAIQYSEIILVSYSGDHTTAYDTIDNLIKSFNTPAVQFAITEQSKGGMISSAEIVIGAMIRTDITAEELASVLNTIKSIVNKIAEKNNLKKK